MRMSTVARRQTDPDLSLLERLRAGDELALSDLVQRHQTFLLRLALLFVRDRASAEEVVQETWMALLKAIGGFQGRSNLKTWMYRILIRRAQTRVIRESRSIPLSALPRSQPQSESVGDLVPNDTWPPSQEKNPEKQLIERETMRCLELAVQQLPIGLRAVVTLRDIEGIDSGEVCNLLGISERTQRVRLHRARSRLRAALKMHLAEASGYPQTFAMAAA